LRQLDVSPNTTILELGKHFDTIKDLRSAFFETKNKAQNEVRCIKAFIEDIESVYMAEKTEEFFDELQNKTITIPMRFYNGWEFDYLSFQCMQEGYSPTLYDLRNCFLTYEILDSSQFDITELKEKLEQLSLGVANAEFLNDLKNQLFALTGKHDNKKPKPNNLKPVINTEIDLITNHLSYFE